MSGILQAIKFVCKPNSINLALKTNPHKLNVSRECLKLNQIRSFASNVNQVQKRSLSPLFKTLIGTGLIASGAVYIARENVKLEDLDNIQVLSSCILKSILGYFVSFAKCDDSGTKHRRTDHFEKILSSQKDQVNKNKDPDFDWNEFFKLIWKEKFYMLAAVAVSSFNPLWSIVTPV
jgi:hypothetical protein